MTDVPNSAARRRFALIVLAGILLLAAMLGLWLVDAVRDAREVARRVQCKGQFCGIVSAMYNYHDVYGSFPPAYVSGPDGKRWHSWRTLLLPFIEESAIYEKYRFDEPWNGPNNWPLVETKILRGFQCPSGADYEVTPFTNYVVVVGEGTAFPGPEAVSLNEINDPETAILFVEAVNLNIHWAEPRDLELDSMSFQVNDPKAPSISSPHDGGAYVCYARGFWSTWLSAASTGEDLKRRLVVPRSGSGEPRD